MMEIHAPSSRHASLRRYLRQPRVEGVRVLWLKRIQRREIGRVGESDHVYVVSRVDVDIETALLAASAQIGRKQQRLAASRDLPHPCVEHPTSKRSLQWIHRRQVHRVGEATEHEVPAPVLTYSDDAVVAVAAEIRRV